MLTCICIHSYGQSYTIKKIDSTSNHYIISICEKEEFKGIIISRKDSNECCIRSCFAILKVGNSYNFNLREYRLFSYLKNSSFATETSGEGGINVDGVEIWKAKDSFVLYETDDLNGLLYVKSNETKK